MPIKNSHQVKSGIGHADDLKVALVKGAGDNIFPQIHNGVYYLNGQEFYLYAKEISTTVSISPYITNVILSSNLATPSKYGPLIINGIIIDYIRVSSTLSTYYEVVPSGSTLMSATVPGELVMLTLPNGTDMKSVPSTGVLSERDLYYWDTNTRTFWINRNILDSNKGETLYATYLKEQPSLPQEEILYADRDGLVRTIIGRVFYSNTAPGSSYNPLLYVVGTGAISVSGTYDNVIYPTSILSEGTRVFVKYYVDGSFCANTDGLSIFRSVVDDVDIRWEGSVNQKYLDIGRFPNTDLNYVQLNPLNTGVSQGFLYLDQPRSPAETLSSLRLDIAPLRISNKQREVLRIKVTTLDSDNLPLPQIPVSCWVTPTTSGDVIYTTTSLDTDNITWGTDLTGQAHFALSAKPEWYGNYTVYASAYNASGEILTVSAPFQVVDPPILTELANTAKVYLYLNPIKDVRNRQELYVYLTDQSAIPYYQNLRVRLKCSLGKFYYSTTTYSSGQNQGSQEIIVSLDSTLSNNGLRITSCKYESVPTDRIYAYPENNDSDSSNPIIAIYKFESSYLEI